MKNQNILILLALTLLLFAVSGCSGIFSKEDSAEKNTNKQPEVKKKEYTLKNATNYSVN